MATESTRTGIEVVGEVAWGTHLCHFYETRQDLLDILIPYFSAGLEAREFCVWVVAEFPGEEARDALRRDIPGADRVCRANDREVVGRAGTRESELHRYPSQPYSNTLQVCQI